MDFSCNIISSISLLDIEFQTFLIIYKNCYLSICTKYLLTFVLFQNCSVDGVVEGERVHLECRLEPVNDPNLRVEWYVNGVEIKAGK